MKQDLEFRTTLLFTCAASHGLPLGRAAPHQATVAAAVEELRAHWAEEERRKAEEERMSRSSSKTSFTDEHTAKMIAAAVTECRAAWEASAAADGPKAKPPDTKSNDCSIQ